MKAGRWAALVLAGVISGCALANMFNERAAFTKVGFSYDRAELVRADIPLVTPDAKAHMKVTLNVANPNTIAATLDSLDYDLYLEGVKVGSGVMSESFSVPAGESKKLVVPISVPYAGLPSAAMQAILNRRVLMTLKGTGHIDTPLGKFDYPIELTQTVTF